MHDETIPAPLLHREAPRTAEAPPSSSLILKVIVVAVLALCVIAPLLR